MPLLFRLPLLALLSLIPAIACAQAPAAPRFYLALGDSITVGLHTQAGTTYSGDRHCSQPSIDSTGRGGWVCLFYDQLKTQDPGLRLKNMALDGEDSCSFLSGVVCGVSTRMVGGEGKPSYNPARTTQMAATLKFIRRHPGEVKVITFEVGGNDLLSLLADGQQGAADEPAALQRIENNDTVILDRLHAAAPNATLVLFDLYNPISGSFLADLFPGLNSLMDNTATQYQHFVQDEAARYGAVFVDLKGSFSQQADQYIGDDLIHPTDAGQREIATLMWTAWSRVHHPVRRSISR